MALFEKTDSKTKMMTLESGFLKFQIVLNEY